MRRLLVALFVLALPFSAARAQDGFDLPAELFVLGNDGQITMIGIGAQGIRQVTPRQAGQPVFVVDFAVGPDGRTLAYRTLEGLFVAPLDGSDAPRTIAASASLPALRGLGQTIAWSEAADALLSTTLEGAQVHWLRTGQRQDIALGPLEHLVWWGDYAALRGPGGLWWIMRRQGDSLILVSVIPQSNGMRWIDAERLLFAPPEGGLVEMDLANANAQTPRRVPQAVYHILGTDERAIIFIGQTPEAVRLSDEQGQVISQVALDVRQSWPMPDGSALLRLANGVLSLVDPLSGEAFALPLPLASAYGWGIVPSSAQLDPSLLPSPSVPVSFIAPFGGVRQVWSWGQGAPQVLTPAQSDVSDYALSADGRRVAYVSEGQLWEYRIGMDEPPRALARLGGGYPPALAYGPDGALYYRDEQLSGEQAQAGIWRVPPDGAPVLFIPDEPGRLYLEALPAPDVAALLINALADDLPTLFNVRADDGSLEVMAYGMAWARWLRSGQFVAAQGGSLYRFDVNQPAPQVLPAPILTLRGARLLDAAPLSQAGQWRALVVEDSAALPRVLLVQVAEGGDPVLLRVPGYLAQARLLDDGQTVLGLEGQGRPVIDDGARRYGPRLWGAARARWG
ncbi:MAG: hypothetical protein NZ750_09805 [Anaerolineae bacterium]|nr:hypothetical protein [Anaerolineae bacterium]MDW8171915.1 hypothetical protein [Anaerolineae bacterium]